MDSTVAAVEDGTLKINTNIQSTQDLQGIHYIEQNDALSQLFRHETTDKIERQQNSIHQEERHTTERLFLTSISSESMIKQYTTHLFREGTTQMKQAQPTVTDTVADPFSWQMGGLLLGASIVMLYSVMKTIRSTRKGESRNGTVY